LRYSFSAADRKMEVSPTKPNAMSDKWVTVVSL
jgi:hypothetical protein